LKPASNTPTSPKPAKAIVAEKGLVQITDSSAIEALQHKKSPPKGGLFLSFVMLLT